MTITLLLIILILLIWLYVFWQKYRNAMGMYEYWKLRALDREDKGLAGMRKLEMQNLELQSELEEAERKMKLLRQMNEKLRRAE